MQQLACKEMIEKYVPKINCFKIINFLTKKGINDFNVIEFRDAFNCIEGIEYKV
jgi:nitrogen regulatory protein PII-like uncharacterized protein